MIINIHAKNNITNVDMLIQLLFQHFYSKSKLKNIEKNLNK